ncbi:Small basic protein [Clostridium collagenovorans DSM 3089]|uniref:Small basic protein n=1 Tax=Clostridium collagenovorans DSM 3089 TaxID=1121306 RepID=A0A1M5T137_9CLOT|nr:small basic family protein [Clostridium collagenovorans]SHH44350.1 Small basic protein [Clostridium collagenovorans DSM 3089]
MVALIGLILGIIIGLIWNINIPLKFSPYISVAIFACLDSIFGGVRATLNKQFKPDIFLSGFFGNALIAVLLVYLGDKLGLPIYLAAVIVFGSRVLNNFAIIRRILLEKVKHH